MRDVSFSLPRLDRLPSSRGDAIVLFRFAHKEPLFGIAGLVDWRLHGHLSRLVIRNFLTGARRETLLVPLGARVEASHLLVVGLGDPDEFGSDVAREALLTMFDAIEKLAVDATLHVALPGRPEGCWEATEAIDLFLETADQQDPIVQINILEESGPQKIMLAATDRWRLKKSVPPERPDSL